MSDRRQQPSNLIKGLQLINNEDTLKAIYFHEYAHVINNHFQFKKIKLQQNNNKSS